MKSLDLPLFAAPATLRALAEARAVAILSGGYDGSGNYGDIAQQDAALGLLEPLGPELLVLPVLERAHQQAHRELSTAFQRPPEHALFFDPEHSWKEDGLLPVAAPPTLAVGALYLYGSGFFDPSRGERKLAMLRTMEELLQAAGVSAPVRLASGVPADPAWLQTLPPEDAALVRSFELLGGRDPLSTRALAAIPVLAAPAAATEPPAELEINLHFGDHEWVSDRTDELRTRALDLVAELGRQAARPVRLRPLIANLDRRVDERPGLEALLADAARRGIEAVEPRVLRPAGLEATLPELGRAAVTISCSYHVALTSLLLGVPAVLFADNPCYEQKAAGLVEAFDLPPSFALSPGSDLAAVAAAVLAGDGRLRDGIARGGEELRRLRARAEVELLSRLAGGILAATSAEIGELRERLRERAAEPAELRVKLAALQTEADELRRPAVEAAIAAAEQAAERATERAERAEADAAAAHRRLAELFGSRSWRLVSPLRKVGAALRRRIGRGQAA